MRRAKTHAQKERGPAGVQESHWRAYVRPAWFLALSLAALAYLLPRMTVEGLVVTSLFTIAFCLHRVAGAIHATTGPIDTRVAYFSDTALERLARDPVHGPLARAVLAERALLRRARRTIEALDLELSESDDAPSAPVERGKPGRPNVVGG